MWVAADPFVPCESQHVLTAVLTPFTSPPPAPTLSLFVPAEPRQFEPLLAAAASAGFALDVSSSKALADSLDNAARGDDKYFNTLVRMMATR